jgi:TPP-dependent pyruvate/acetoin dehydrogenase alpha subunit
MDYNRPYWRTLSRTTIPFFHEGPHVPHDKKGEARHTSDMGSRGFQVRRPAARTGDIVMSTARRNTGTNHFGLPYVCRISPTNPDLLCLLPPIYRMLGANGIVAAGASLALGSAMAFKVRKTRQVATVFFGDGAVGEGIVHESMNLAALWRLPLLLVCEHNGWAEFSPSARQIAVDLKALAGAFGIPFRSVDGNDVVTVNAAAVEIIGSMRVQSGPHILECRTRRVRGHYEGDAQKYRVGEETDAAGDDPLVRCEQKLTQQAVPPERLRQIESAVGAQIESAVAAARAAPEPAFGTALADTLAGS